MSDKPSALSEAKIYENGGNFPLLTEIRPKNNQLVLDIGCGAGQNGRYLANLDSIVDGITLSKEESKLAAEHYRNVWIFNIENGLPAEIDFKYDVIILSHVLEHIAYPSKLLSAIQTISHAKTEIHIALPNIMNYRSRMQLMLGNFNYQYSGIWDFTHLRWYTYKTSKDLMTDHGFDIKKHWVSGEVPWLSVMKFILPKSARSIIFSILAKISPGFFGGQIHVIATVNKTQS